jgi:hypothetical protein
MPLVQFKSAIKCFFSRLSASYLSLGRAVTRWRRSHPARHVAARRCAHGAIDIREKRRRALWLRLAWVKFALPDLRSSSAGPPSSPGWPPGPADPVLLQAFRWARVKDMAGSCAASPTMSCHAVGGIIYQIGDGTGDLAARPRRPDRLGWASSSPVTDYRHGHLIEPEDLSWVYDLIADLYTST